MDTSNEQRKRPTNDDENNKDTKRRRIDTSLWESSSRPCSMEVNVDDLSQMDDLCLDFDDLMEECQSRPSTPTPNMGSFESAPDHRDEWMLEAPVQYPTGRRYWNLRRAASEEWPAEPPVYERSPHMNQTLEVSEPRASGSSEMESVLQWSVSSIPWSGPSEPTLTPQLDAAMAVNYPEATLCVETEEGDPHKYKITMDDM